jgi:hypothetical protein
MSSRVVWTAIVVALVAGAIGYYYGKGAAPPPPQVAAPPPMAGTAPPASCLEIATLTWDGSLGTLTLFPKPSITVDYPGNGAPSWAICWQLAVKNSADAFPFDQLRLDIAPKAGQHGKPVLVGDTNFRDNHQMVSVRFLDEPVWSAGADPHVVVPYTVVARLKGQSSDLVVDPDIVIRKPPGGLTG